MILRPPRATRTDTLFPYTPLFRSPPPRCKSFVPTFVLRSYPRRSFRMDTAARAFLLFSRTYNHSFIRRFCQMRPRSIVQDSNTVGAIFRQRWTVVFDSAARRLSSLGKLQSSVPHADIRRDRQRRVGNECVRT